jgi:hypothetical protein
MSEVGGKRGLGLLKSLRPPVVSAAPVGPQGHWNTLARSNAFMIMTVFVIMVASDFFGERVQVGNGFGWDGVNYGAWARHFREEVFVKKVGEYYIQRVLPSAVVHYGLKLFHVARTNENIINGFAVYTISLFVLGAWCWCKIAETLKLSLTAKWVGCIGLFFNYISLKFFPYYPVLTDSTAYISGIVMLLCYLRGWHWRLAFVALLGSFAWQTTMYIAAILLVFPRDEANDQPVRPAPRFAGPLAFLLVAAWAMIVRQMLAIPPSVKTIMIQPEFVQFHSPTLCISIAVSLAYVAFGAFYLLNSNRWLYSLRSLLTRRRLVTLLIVLLGVLAVRFVQGRLAAPARIRGLFTGFDGGSFAASLGFIVYTSLVRPGVFVVANIAQYGPFFILLLLYWKRTCRLLHENGIAMPLVASVALLISLNSQSRFWINIFPMMVPFVVKALDDRPWRFREVALLAGSSFLLSKAWYTINTGPFRGQLLEFPDQGFFMAHGPWISTAMYALQGGIFLVVAVALYFVFGNRKPAPAI